MCNNCIHKIVCSKYIATGGVNNCEHYKEERKGRWERMVGMMPPEYHGRHTCSCCGVRALDRKFHEELSNYCPNCGADMRGNENG